MPVNCSVPQCNSVNNKNKDVKFHQFPKCDKLKEKWIIAIRSGKTPTIFSKVCSKHFLESDYKITSMGQWKILNPAAIPSVNLPRSKHDKKTSKDNARSQRFMKRQANKGSSNEEIEEEGFSISSQTFLDSPDVSNIQQEVNINFEAANVESDPAVGRSSKNTQTVVSYLRSQLISESFLTEDQLKHFSGFYRHEFNLICYLFRTNSNYNSALKMEDEILLTLMKFRHNYYYTSLQAFFDVDQRVVHRIINFWTNHMYAKLKSVDFWSMKCKRSTNEYDIIIDCTEFPIEKSQDPVIQQTTYSQYKSTNTFKVLVGCTEYGAVVYVSDVYGGSTTDRVLTEKSGFLDNLKGGEFVLADRGFDISDLLESKGVHLNIPPFKLKNQLSEQQVAVTRAIANRRIIIEQLNGLAKKNKILVDRIPVYLWSLANQFIYVCFMLTSFRNTIVK